MEIRRSLASLVLNHTQPGRIGTELASGAVLASAVNATFFYLPTYGRQPEALATTAVPTSFPSPRKTGVSSKSRSRSDAKVLTAWFIGAAQSRGTHLLPTRMRKWRKLAWRSGFCWP